MRRSLLFASLLTLALCACSQNKNSTDIRVGNPDDDNGKGGSSKPTAPASNERLQHRAMNELVRLRRATLAMMDPPKVSAQDGCISYVPRNEGIRFLTGHYDCGEWFKTGEGESAPQYFWRTTGKERFSSVEAPKRQWMTQSRLTLKAFKTEKETGTAPTYVTQVVREIMVDREPPGTAPSQWPYHFEMSTEEGSTSKTSSMVWRSRFSGDWLVNGKSSKALSEIRIDDGLLMEISYLDNAEMTIGSKGSVIFSRVGDCFRPIGEFEWTLTRDGRSSAGSFTATAIGMQFTPGGATLEWGQCPDAR